MKSIKKYININNQKFNYILYIPDNLKENMPLLLFMHGIGERGDNLNLLEKYALPKYLKKLEIPYIVIAPQCQKNNFWDYHLRDVEKILEIEYKNYHYNKKRICLLGTSMGAYGAFNYIIQRPNLFKGIISVSGGIMLPIKQNLLLIKNKPILLYHGDKDEIIDLKESQKAYQNLKEVGATSTKLKIIKNDNHYLSSHAFKDKYIFKWLERNI